MTKIAIKSIVPNPQQPRQHFDPDSIQELAESIQKHGLVQPIVVEMHEDHYVLVSGERRVRAHQQLGLKTIEAVIRPRTNNNGRELLISAIVENVQREDMDPVETAKAYGRLRDEFGMGPEEISRTVGKAPTQIYASLNLLKAEPEIQELWATHAITHEPRAVTAVLDVPAGAERVQLMRELARRKATGKMIISACERFRALRNERGNRVTKAVATARSIASWRPEWDALYQLGKVPPWPVLNDAVTDTCDRCALRPQASEAVCGSCAMVSLLQDLLETVHGK